MTSEGRLPPLMEAHLTHLRVERGRATNTLAAYRRDLRLYTDWLAAHDRTAGEAEEADLVAFVDHLVSEGRAATSVARILAAVRGYHRFAAREEGGDDPGAHVRPPGVPRPVPRALAEEQVGSLIDGVDTSTPVGVRDRAVLEVLYGAGIRVSELCGLDLGDVDLDGRLIRVTGKGQRERLVPIGTGAVHGLEEWLDVGRPALARPRPRSRGEAAACFLGRRGGRLTRQAVWDLIQAHALRAGLPTALISPHVLRHSYATHLLDHGVDIRVVQELLGHRTISTTQVYTRVAVERLHRSYREAHPRARRAVTSTPASAVGR